MLRRTFVVSTTLLLAMALAVPALGGMSGGAIVTIDHAPDDFVAGETHEVMYTVMWMGDTPITEASALEFRPGPGTEGPVSLRFEGVPTSTPGQYIAEVTLPASGAWTWNTRHSNGMTDLGSVEASATTIGSLLNHDGLALTLALAVATGLVLLLSRTQPELRTGILDHRCDVAAEGA